MRWQWLVGFGVGLAMASVSGAHEYRIETVAEGLEHPWSLAFLPDDVILVSERAGRLRVIDEQGLRAEPVADLPEIFVSGQAGLFHVLVDPRYARNRTVFLSYAHGDADGNHLRIARAEFDGERLLELTPIFTSVPAKRGDAHYGARMLFMDDGTLVAGYGDGFVYRERAQHLDDHLGTIVRIDRDGQAPIDNPFIGRADVLPEIYSYGHRNVQGLVFDASSRFLYAHEHGPRGGDELNVIRPGRNYGWPLATHGVDYTGARVTPFTEYPRTIAPMLDWTPSIAPSGMTQYHGDLFPDWQGDLFVSTLAERSVRRIILDEGIPVDQQVLFTELGVRLRDVIAGPDGALYLLTDQPSPHGRVLRVVPP